jgi:hypothetical protein
VDLDIFRETFATNLFGVVATTEALLPLLLDAPIGRIVNVSSTAASLTDQSDPDSAYYRLVVPSRVRADGGLLVGVRPCSDGAGRGSTGEALAAGAVG